MISIINKNYPIHFDNIEIMRDGGSTSYSAISGGQKYFLRVIKPAFYDTAKKGIEIQVFLQRNAFPVPAIIPTNYGRPYIQEKRGDGDYLYVLYEYIEGAESEPEHDAEKIGALLGKLHLIMKNYSGELVKADKPFFIGRYIEILHRKQYERTAEFEKYGDTLWGRIKDLPRGYSHGDMYCGNIHKTPAGDLYILDFDTSCNGFPLYDLALICNRTDYFSYDESGFEKSKAVFERVLSEYEKHSSISRSEINAFYDFIALYHFALQATIIEIHGIDCVDGAFFDKQLEWLYKWREQCERANISDIPEYNSFKEIKPIDEGVSNDKKYQSS